MIPLNDTEPNRYTEFPVMTVLIIVINVIITSWETYLMYTEPVRLNVIFHTFGTVPAMILSQQGVGWLSAITTTFLHGSISHLISNMFPLWVFGRRVEDACGPWRYLVFYLSCGVWANIVFTFVHHELEIPGIGASGAVFGLMGAYLLLYPRGRIRVVIPLPYYLMVFPKIRAYWIVLYFLAWQILPAYLSLMYQIDFRIAYWAHLGGFFAAILIFLFLRPEAFERYINGASV
jgi:membrane associated rhomboid family serine protease